MNKKGFELKDIILALVSLAVLLFVGSFFYEALGQTGQKTTCSWSMLLSKVSSFTATDLPPECKANDRYVTLKTLEAYDITAQDTVQEYHKTPGYESISAIYPQSTLGYQQWELDKIMAGEMVGCWDKTWHGKLNAAKMAEILHTHVLCVLCSKIEFDPDLPSALKRQKLQLTPWMRSEMYYGKTYFDYLMQDQEPEAWQKAPWYDLDRRWAVVYWYVEPDYAAQALLKIPGLAKGAGVIATGLQKIGLNVEVKQQLTQVYLWPYDDITKPMEQGGLGCEKLIG